ncbi:MAG: RHS repeat-associated core domain-containing protein [Phycisphaerales bacterium]
MWIEPGRNPVTEQAAVSVGYQYNRIGNITARTDDRIGAAAMFRDETYEFDELDRLTQRTLTPAPGLDIYQTDWQLDTFGNWEQWTVNEDPDPSPSHTFAFQDIRTHDEANQLTQQTIGTKPPVGFTFDHAGNMVQQQLSAGSSRKFVYDAWNRLVQVGYDTGSGVQDRVRYRYYPGGERAASLVDTDVTSPILPDELNLFFYDASWRLLEIRSDRTGSASWSFPASTAPFTLSNTRQFIWGERYIDELVAYMSDTAAVLNADGTLATDPTFARLDYALTDRNFSVIGTGFTSGEIGDRVRYDPYGTFQAFPAGDVNRDGAVNSGDTTAIMFASGYQADLDVNMDGAVDSKDSGVVSKLRGRSLGAGELSDRGNIVGWCGYLYEEATGMWLARHRWQIPELGRWANRDPLGYAGGGQNLYEYVNGNPVFLQDPSGLIGGLVDMIGEGFQQAKSDIGNWLFDTDTEEVHEQQTDNHYNICDNFRKRLGMGRDVECQTEEEWEEQKANLHAAYANNGCDGPPVLTDFGEIAIDALKESAHGFITGDPEHWDEVQDYLDWVGMAPGVGIIADGMNLAISLVRGNWSRALWSASAMVPGWGNASQGVRFGLRGAGGGAAAGGLALAGRGRLPVLKISRKQYPEMAENIYHAQRAGHPSVLTRAGE